jgi:hypothetical protein
VHLEGLGRGALYVQAASLASRTWLSNLPACSAFSRMVAIDFS